jgi:hypothetical protein
MGTNDHGPWDDDAAAVAATTRLAHGDAEPRHTDDRQPIYLIMGVWAEGSNQQRNHSD